MVAVWIEDLKATGVHNGIGGGRLPTCSYDKMMLDFTYDAMLGSCSDALQRELKSDLVANQFNGPCVLFETFSYCSLSQ